MSDEPEAVVVLSTAPDDEVAARVARALVEGGLAACVNIVPGVRSIYRWEGKVCDDQERLLVIKTRAARQDDVVAAIKHNHPYTCPEAIALPIIGGAPAYLAWVQETTA
ncbi:MAG: divalent-cation tolerance protein CutA [Planctomycetes bacterium]|nr:divalent-cation tolerance protein CutA [Planctomycetota bacterium]